MRTFRAISGDEFPTSSPLLQASSGGSLKAVFPQEKQFRWKILLYKNVVQGIFLPRRAKFSAKKTDFRARPLCNQMIRRSRCSRSRGPHICPAGENFENRGLVLRGSLRENVFFRPGPRAPGNRFLGAPFCILRKRFLEKSWRKFGNLFELPIALPIAPDCSRWLPTAPHGAPLNARCPPLNARVRLGEGSVGTMSDLSGPCPTYRGHVRPIGS